MTTTAIAKRHHKTDLSINLASHLGMDPDNFFNTLVEIVMPPQTTTAEVQAFLVVANEYKLNPFTKELYAFKGKNNKINAVVSVDGWARIVNEHPEYDGVSFAYHEDAQRVLIAVTAVIHRKDRAHAIEVTEYLSECTRNTDPWKKSPRRMLRHKAFIQCARLAFGFAGIMDREEYERMEEAEYTDESPSGDLNDKLDALTEKGTEAVVPIPHVEEIPNTQKTALPPAMCDGSGLIPAEDGTALDCIGCEACCGGDDAEV